MGSMMAQSEQDDAITRWLKEKQLVPIAPDTWETPGQLAVFLKLRGYDVSLWGYEKGSKTVESLFRELKTFKSCLCEMDEGDGKVTNIVRCVSSLRVRFVDEDNKAEPRVLLQQVTKTSGRRILAPPTVRLKMAEPPFKAAERLLFKMTGVAVHREQTAEEDLKVDFPGRLHEEKDKTPSLSMRGVQYIPLQYDNPLEYESLSSSTYPTLTTLYRINILTLQLRHSFGGSLDSIASVALEAGKSLVWQPEAVARQAFSHLEVYDLPGVNSSNRKKNALRSGDTSKSSGFEDDGDDRLEGEMDSAQNHTVRHLMKSQRFTGVSQMDLSKNGQMESVLVDLIEKAQAYFETKRKARAMGFLNASSLFHNGISIAKNALPSTYPWGNESEPEPLSASGKRNTLSFFTKQSPVNYSQRVRSKSVMTSFFHRLQMEYQVQTVFQAMSFSKTGELLPLADCEWFLKMQQVHEKTQSVSFFSESAIELFQLWLVTAGLDVTRYNDEEVRSLLEETITQKCELLLHQRTGKLERVARIAKVMIYDSDQTEADEFFNSRFLEEPPKYSRRLVVQRISQDENAEDSVEGVSMDFSMVLNKKARGNEYMLDVVRDVVVSNFKKQAFTPSTKKILECNPTIKSLFMLEPKTEVNISPTFPGLLSRYYLHQFWVRLEGIPSGENFCTEEKGGRMVSYWMWTRNLETSIFQSRIKMLAYFVNQRTCEENAKDFLSRVCIKSPNSLLTPNNLSILAEESIKNTYLKLFRTQLVDGCKTDDSELVEYAIASLLRSDIVQNWKQNDKVRLVLSHMVEAINAKSWKAARALLNQFMFITAHISAQPRKPNSKTDPRTQQYLTHLNTVFVVSSLINSRQRVLDVKKALVEEGLDKYSAAAFCILPAIRRGHAKMLRLLFPMIPHFVNGPFYPSAPELQMHHHHIRPLWEVTGSVCATFGLSEDILHLLCDSKGRVAFFLPGHVTLTSTSRMDAPRVKTYTEIFIDALKSIRTKIPAPNRRLGKVDVISGPDESSSDQIEPFGWESLLYEICGPQVVRSQSPLDSKMTKILGVALNYCPPDLDIYKTFLEVFLISIVSVCWNDNTIFGYELESQRMIIKFLQDSHFSFHSALLITAQLRKLSRGKTYYNNEFGVLYEWMNLQCKRMIESCTSQEEANAMLFEQIRVENEISTRDTFVLGVGAVQAANSQSVSETSALFFSIECRVEKVVASKWFQGTNEKKLWFYEWHRMDRFPHVYEACSSSLLRTFGLTMVILMELFIMLPIWCAAPFSIRLSAWRDQLAINSAYFKFVSHTFLHFLFVVYISWFASTASPVLASNYGSSPDSFTLSERLLFVWVLGLVASEAHAIYFDPRNYMSSAVNLVDVLYLACFVTAFGFRHSASTIHSDKNPPGVWNNTIKRMLMEPDVDDVIGWFDEDGSWTAFSAISLSEVFFAFGSLMAVYRLVHLSSYHAHLGPLYESIKKMGLDILLFSFLLATLLLGNGLALSFVLRRYAGDDEYFLGTNEAGDPMLSDMRGTTLLLGKILFSGEVPDATIPLASTDKILWYVLIVFHLLTVVIVLLSLLIAMMNRTYERTQDDAREVYLNGRMDLIKDYAGLPVVPPPLNVLTIPFEILALVINHFRYGNSRAVFLKQERSSSFNGLGDALGILGHTKESVSGTIREELVTKRRYQVNNSMRKIRCSVLQRYFEEVRKELKMPNPNEELRKRYEAHNNPKHQSPLPFSLPPVKTPPNLAKRNKADGDVPVPHYEPSPFVTEYLKAARAARLRAESENIVSPLFH